jgi:type II secretion system protein N
MPSNVRKSVKYAAYVVFFFISLLFFVYITFPYGVLKETLRNQISAASNFDVRINSLSPRLLIGMNAQGVDIRPKGSEAVLSFKNVSVSINPFSLLLGRIGIGLKVEEQTGGKLDIGLGLGIFSLISGNPLPSSINVQASSFSLDNLGKFGLTYLSDAPDTNPLVGPLLKKIGISGKLVGKVDLRLDSSDPSKSSGMTDININQAVLKLNDPSLNLPDQNFSKAQLKASLDSGRFVIDPVSGFKASELDLTFKGKVDVKPQIDNSSLDLIVGVKLDNELKNQFGFIMDAVTKQTTNGEMSLQLRGPLGNPTVTQF